MKQLFLSMNLCILSVCSAYAMEAEQEDPYMGLEQDIQGVIRRWQELKKLHMPKRQEECPKRSR